jgi:hypothetical protein
MPKFSVTIVETVIMTYAPIVVEAQNKADAINKADALRADGQLPDAIHEDCTDVAFKAEPDRTSKRAPPDTAPEVFLTEMGREALAEAVNPEHDAAE